MFSLLDFSIHYRALKQVSMGRAIGGDYYSLVSGPEVIKLFSCPTQLGITF